VHLQNITFLTFATALMWSYVFHGWCSALNCRVSLIIYCCLSFQVLLLLILFVLRSRISLVVALFREAGKCLTSVPMLLIQPLWTFLILSAFFAYWFTVLIFIATLGKILFLYHTANRWHTVLVVTIIQVQTIVTELQLGW